MSAAPGWHRALLVVGTLLMILGAIDPLEGSLVILPGVVMVALGAFLGGSRHTRMLAWAAALTAIGVVMLFALSARGGIGGPNGLPWWTGILLLPYPAGWIMGLVGAFLRFRELRKV